MHSALVLVKTPKLSGGSLVLLAVFIAALFAVPILFDNSVEFRMLFVTVFFACLMLGLRDRSLFSPFFLFSLVPLSVALYDYRFVPYYLSPLDSTTYWLIFYNSVVFIVGLAMFRWKPSRLFGPDLENPRDLRRLTWISLIIGLVPTFYVLAAAPGLVLSGRVLEAAVYAQEVPLSWVLGLFKYFAVAAAFRLGDRRTIVIVLGLCLAALALSFNKTQMLFFLMTIFVVLYKYYRNTARQRAVFNGISVFGVALLIFSVVAYDDARQDFDSTANLIRVGASQVLSEGLMLPYMYFVSAWNNLQFVIDTQPDHTWGAWAVRPIVVLLGQAGQLSDTYALMPANSFNTFSFLTVHWKDFGFIGSGLLTFLLAIYVRWIFQRFQESASPTIVAVYGINAVATVEMFFSNHFFGLVYPFMMTAIGVLLQRSLIDSRTSRRFAVHR